MRNLNLTSLSLDFIFKREGIKVIADARLGRSSGSKLLQLCRSKTGIEDHLE